MKTELTIEQSQRLIELGVSIDKASSESMVGGSIFTLTDLLGIINRIKDKEGKPYTFGFGFNAGGKNQSYSAIYEPLPTCVITPYTLLYRAYDPELIDALFRLTLWCIENKHLQL